MKADQPFQPGQLDELAARVAYLIAGYIGENLTEEEHQELDDWVTASMDNQRLFENLTDPRNLTAMMAWKEELNKDQVLQRLQSKLNFTPEPPTISRFQSWRPYVLAASVLLVMATTALLLFQKSTPPPHTEVSHVKGKDIAPGANRATLTLADGTVVMLDDTKKGVQLNQGNVTVSKMDSGHINYSIVNQQPPRTIVFNTLTVPRGGQFRVTLPDGTRVWLNAASSLRYPTFFGTEHREVELTGEGYFEVAKDASHPFVVKTNHASVEVLGTHFNVNAYEDEKVTRVVLAEGAVAVNTSVQIKPGQEAIIDQSGDIKTGQADLKTSLAWKDGQFLFKNAPIDEVLRQVARWYDAEIINEAGNSEHFNAEIPRDVPVSKLLHLLQSTGSVNFDINDKKITVIK